LERVGRLIEVSGLMSAMSRTRSRIPRLSRCMTPPPAVAGLALTGYLRLVAVAAASCTIRSLHRATQVQRLMRQIQRQDHGQIGAARVVGSTCGVQGDHPQPAGGFVLLDVVGHPGRGHCKLGCGEQQVSVYRVGALGVLELDHVAELGDRHRMEQPSAVAAVGQAKSDVVS
jgi:hypothetical protein